MPMIRWSPSLLALTLALTGCKANPPPPSATNASAPTASATPRAAPPAALTGPALSYLKPAGDTKCEWVRQPLPAGSPTTLFSFDAACEPAWVSWSPDSQEGLVFSWPEGEGVRPRLWRVDFRAKTGSPVDLTGLLGPADTRDEAHAPIIARTAFNTQGTPVALVSVRLEAQKGEAGTPVVSYQGQRYPLQDSDGPPLLVLAYRLEGSAWKPFEAKVGSAQTDSVDLLEAARSLHQPGFSSSGTLPGQKVSEGVSRKLDTALTPRDRFGHWRSLPTSGGNLLYRAQQKDEDDDARVAAPLRWEQDGGWVQLEGFTAKDGTALHLQLREPWLAVLALGSPSSVSVFDVGSKKSLVSLSDVQAATLWPEPLKP